ncbi:IS2 transposase TnpB [compost metagenome]
MDIAESTYYDRKKRAAVPKTESSSTGKRGRPTPGYSLTETGVPISDEQIKEWLLELLEGEEHVYGYKLLGQCIRDVYQVIINKKKTYRLCKELGILQKARSHNPSHPRTLPKNRFITGSNQLWQMDIKYGYVVGQKRFFFVLSIIDVFDRVVVGQYRGRTCEAKHAVQALMSALERRIQPGETLPVIRTDNGPQFVSKLFRDTCESLGMTQERIPARTPNMNAYIESFHSILERNLFSRREFMTFEEAFVALDQYMDFYNHRRMHGSLKRMSPMKFSLWVKTLEDTSKFHKSM